MATANWEQSDRQLRLVPHMPRCDGETSMRWNPAKLAWALTVAASAAACREPNPYVEPPPSSYSVTKVELASDSTRDSVNVAVVQPRLCTGIQSAAAPWTFHRCKANTGRATAGRGH